MTFPFASQISLSLIFSFGQIMADLHILTNERIILQLYEITQMFVDFLQRYDNLSMDIRYLNVISFIFFLSSNFKR